MQGNIWKQKISFLQLILTLLSITALLVSNLIQKPLSIGVTAGFIVFPITYILSDVFSEVYGYKWSRITCYLGFAANLLAVICYEAAIYLPPYVEAYNTVLGQAPRVFAGSVVGFLLGDFVNDRIFLLMKWQKGQKGFCGRAFVSSIAGECVDSLCFFPIAFLGVLPVAVVVRMALLQTALKLAYELILLPVTRLVVKRCYKYEEWQSTHSL